VVFEDDETIVYSMHTFLLPAISENDSLQRLVSLSIAQLDHKSVWPIELVADVELSEDRGSVRRLGSPANPELHRIFRGRVDDELLLHLIICGCGFDSSYIGSVSQFCQSKAPNVDSFLGSILPLLVLLSPQVCEGFVVEGQGDYYSCGEILIVEVSFSRKC